MGIGFHLDDIDKETLKLDEHCFETIKYTDLENEGPEGVNDNNTGFSICTDFDINENHSRRVPFTTVMNISSDTTSNDNIVEIDYNPARVGVFEKVTIEQFWIDAGAHGFTPENDNHYITYNSIELPARSTSKSAGYDFRSPFDFTLAPGQSIIIPTGIRVKMYSNNVLTIYPRSSIGIKHGIMLSNTIPVIDADYYDAKNEGHIMLAFKNTTPKSVFPWRNKHNTWRVRAGDKVAQGIFLQYGITHNDNTNTIRTGGIGSTGV